MITKQQFISLIDALYKQYKFDTDYANSLSDVVNADVSIYNNSSLINCILELLRCSFPMKDGFCEIEHYCYFQNFGRIEKDNDVILETVEEFYDRLLNEKEVVDITNK